MQSSNLHFWSWHENFFFSQLRNFEVEIPIWKYFFWKNGLFSFFLRLEADFFEPMLSRKIFDANYSKIKSTLMYSFSSIDSFQHIFWAMRKMYHTFWKKQPLIINFHLVVSQI